MRHKDIYFYNHITWIHIVMLFLVNLNFKSRGGF